MPPLRRVRYLQHNADVNSLCPSKMENKCILLVLSPCPEVPLASSPGPIEGHHRDHLQRHILVCRFDWDCVNVDLNDSGADTVKELEAEGVGGLGAVHSVHAGIDIFVSPHDH